MPAPPATDVLRFREFELDVAAYELRRSGRAVKIERRPMDLLILLVTRRGLLVPRADIAKHLWGDDVFVDIETGVNTAISKIRQALKDSAEAPAFLETVAGKGYRFISPVEVVTKAPRAEPAPVAAALPEPRRPAYAPAAAIVAGVIGVIALWGPAVWRRAPPVDGAPPQLAPLTTLAGFERGSTFSPDGTQVAFTWSGDAEANWDIHVKVVGGSDVRRLTTDPRRDIAPRWSADGRYIAYVRDEPDGVERVRVMSALGGEDREVSAIPILTTIAWSPDGEYLAAGRGPEPGAAAGIYLIPLRGGEPRVLTVAAAGGIDWMPEFAPDGRRLTFAACQDAGARRNCDVKVVDLDESYHAVGDPRRLTPEPLWSVRGTSWSRDGVSVVYGALEFPFSSLWRVPADGSRAPERMELAGLDAAFPATARSRDRLAFSRSIGDVDIYQRTQADPAQAIARSSVFDGHPQLSPDDRRLAFCSVRSGDALEVWTAGMDGLAASRLTHGPGRAQCAPAWSPDGGVVAFESLGNDGRWHIWSIDARGGPARQLTTSAGDQHAPSWSRDGRWVYFSWDEPGGRDIWRVPAGGGAPARITRGGSGVTAVESLDGKTLVYQPSAPGLPHDPTNAPLLAQPLAGGAPRQIAPCVMSTAFAVAASGVYYVQCANPAVPVADADVVVVDARTGQTRRVGRLERYRNAMPASFAVSRDGQTILYGRLVSASEDLMLLENFK
ncbi:MAG TPA: winged helix-turn-helix domain-containing protein [Vicinamibacterales bacterium]|nr:winged helix-turn-helix domain-containing protein [Vicinamibacterales bacterium]